MKKGIAVLSVLLVLAIGAAAYFGVQMNREQGLHRQAEDQLTAMTDERDQLIQDKDALAVSLDEKTKAVEKAEAEGEEQRKGQPVDSPSKPTSPWEETQNGPEDQQAEEKRDRMQQTGDNALD